MGYAYYERDGMERGYSVSDVCNLECCNKKIDRGLSYLCYSCTKYFCSEHLTVAFAADGDTMIKFDCFAGQEGQSCEACAKKAEADSVELEQEPAIY